MVMNFPDCLLKDHAFVRTNPNSIFLHSIDEKSRKCFFHASSFDYLQLSSWENSLEDENQVLLKD